MKKRKQKSNELPLHELALDYKSTKCEITFNKIYNKLEYPLFEFIFKIIRDVDKAKMVRQITFVKLYQNIDDFNPSYKFLTWIYSIAKHEAYFLYKMDKKDKLTFFSDIYNNDDDPQFDAGDSIMYISTDDAMLSENEYIENLDEQFNDMLLSTKYGIAIDCIECLPERYSLILKDKYINGLKQKEIAEKYDIKFNTVKTRIYNATQNIKVLYKEKTEKLLLDVEYGKK